MHCNEMIGIFAVGDVQSGSVKRVASGVGLGAVSVSYVFKHLACKHEEEEGKNETA